MRPFLSVRPDAARTMAGAIFMSNTFTREQSFQAGVFGLPIEYESFVYDVRKGMPLFLFDHNLRKLYGVFEAASDGGLNINRDAFERAFPAQVRVSIIWKCRPLIEDEFAPAIEENYYQPWKFYFDLSCEQVVRLYKLFDEKRVECPIPHYPINESLGSKDISKRALDKRSLTSNVPYSGDQSHLLVPDISTIVRRYSSHTSKHTVVPPSVEVEPSTTMPSATESFGGQIASITTRHHQLVGSQSFPLHPDYPQHKILSSGRIIQVPSEGAKFIANQLHPSSRDFAHSNSMPSGFVTQNPTYGNPVSATSTSYAPSYRHLSLENSQGNADYQEHCDICIRQRQLSSHAMHPYELQHTSEGSQPGIPAYPEVSEFRGNTVSAVDQQINGSCDYIPLSGCTINFENASGPSNLENDMGINVSDSRHKKYVIGAESNTEVPQSNVFSRLSPSEQPPSHEATGPTLSQLVSSLSQKAKQWNDKNRPVVDSFCYMIREQATDRPYSHSELNLPNELEVEAEATESTGLQPPFLNFKRRSEARKGDTNLGKAISGKVKRRKLVRPSFGENNTSTCSGNCIQERKHDHFDIDLNVPATVDSDSIEKHNNSIEVSSSVLTKTQTEDSDKTNGSNVIKAIKEVEKHNSIEVCPSVLTKTQTEDAEKTNSPSVMETINEQLPFNNDAPAKKVSLDINLAELNTMDESKLRTIFDQASSLWQALGKIASAKSNIFEEDKSNILGEL